MNALPINNIFLLFLRIRYYCCIKGSPCQAIRIRRRRTHRDGRSEANAGRKAGFAAASRSRRGRSGPTGSSGWARPIYDSWA